MKDFKVSECCGKHGFILKYDGLLSGTNFYDSEKESICPVCNKQATYISSNYFIHQKIKENEFTNKIS